MHYSFSDNVILIMGHSMQNQTHVEFCSNLDLREGFLKIYQIVDFTAV